VRIFELRGLGLRRLRVERPDSGDLDRQRTPSEQPAFAGERIQVTNYLGNVVSVLEAGGNGPASTRSGEVSERPRSPLRWRSGAAYQGDLWRRSQDTRRELDTRMGAGWVSRL